MLLHNGGDWIRKLVLLRLRGPARKNAVTNHAPPGTRAEVRMFHFERLQHSVLVISFVTLAWTGFALKYPYQWWARPLLMWEAAYPLRSVIHRIAAVVFLLVAATHLISLAASKRLRTHWLELKPRRRDLAEALRHFAHNVSLRSRKTSRSTYSYIEKAEYWAVVWGATLMASTGVMLWGNTFFFAWLPKAWLDVAVAIHFYEAVLATLAIVVWHLYSVILDPDVYPMDTAWLAGISVEKRHSYSSASSRIDMEDK